jgi:hypothetical protein
MFAMLHTRLALLLPATAPTSLAAGSGVRVAHFGETQHPHAVQRSSITHVLAMHCMGTGPTSTDYPLDAPSKGRQLWCAIRSDRYFSCGVQPAGQTDADLRARSSSARRPGPRQGNLKTVCNRLPAMVRQARLVPDLVR